MQGSLCAISYRAFNRKTLKLTDNETKAVLFDRIGGAPVIDKVVERFYDLMDTVPQARGIRAMHPESLDRVRAVLKDYLGEWMGGPPKFSSVHGHPRLRARHLRFPIGPAERDAWMACMTKALEEEVPDDQIRLPLLQALQNLADWMRNDPRG